MNLWLPSERLYKSFKSCLTGGVCVPFRRRIIVGSSKIKEQYFGLQAETVRLLRVYDVNQCRLFFVFCV